MRAVRTIGIVIVATVLAVVALVAYVSQVAGPGLSARRIGDRVRVEGRFLGEYALDFGRVRIEDAATGAAICDLAGRTPSNLDLAPGVNTPGTMFGQGAVVTFRIGAGACRLAAGQRYRVTAWGNNGWGTVRPTSIDIRF
jgi:hypothetical protein